MTLLQRVEKAENDGIAIRREYSNISTIYFTFQDESIEDMQEIELKRNVKMTYNTACNKCLSRLLQIFGM